jgi:hypothetical protein
LGSIFLGTDPGVLEDRKENTEASHDESTSSPIISVTPPSSAAGYCQRQPHSDIVKQCAGLDDSSNLTFGTYNSAPAVGHHPPSPSLIRQIAQKPDPKPSTPLHRGPGRPKKYESKSQVFKAIKKQSHNISASHSRARLNTVIDELWHLVPEDGRSRRALLNRKRKVTRMEKIEEVIQYIREVQEEL